MRLLRSMLVAFAALLAPAASAAADPSFVPVFREDFPDAFVLLHGSEFIAYATNNGPNVPMARSTEHDVALPEISVEVVDAEPVLESTSCRRGGAEPERRVAAVSVRNDGRINLKAG